MSLLLILMPSFLILHYSCFYRFLSVWRILLIHSLRVGLIITILGFFTFSFSSNIFPLHVWRINFPDTEFTVDNSFNTLKICHFFSDHCFIGETCCVQIGVPLWQCAVFTWLLMLLFLSLFFRNLTMMYLNVCSFRFIMFGAHFVSWVYILYLLPIWSILCIAFLWDWNENWPFPALWSLLSFPNLLAYWVQHFHSIIFQDLK